MTSIGLENNLRKSFFRFYSATRVSANAHEVMDRSASGGSSDWAHWATARIYSARRQVRQNSSQHRLAQATGQSRIHIDTCGRCASTADRRRLTSCTPAYTANAETAIPRVAKNASLRRRWLRLGNRTKTATPNPVTTAKAATVNSSKG